MTDANTLETFCPATMCPLFASDGSPWTGEKNAHCEKHECGWWHKRECTAGIMAGEQIAELHVGGRPLVIASNPSDRRAKPTKYDCPRAAECQWQIECGEELCPPRLALHLGLDPRACAY